GLLTGQTSIPRNIRIQDQIFGRTARNGNDGSGKFIIYDERLHANPHLTIEMLCEIRDIEESKRLDKIRTIGIPKLKREQKLFDRFIELQKRVREKLNTGVRDPKEFDRKQIEAQIKSLQNRWAFFLDELSEKIEDIEGVSENKLMEAFDHFEKTIDDSLYARPFGLITEPAELMKMARHCMDEEVDKDFSKEAAYRLAAQYLDVVIENEEQFSGFAHYYKAYCNFGEKKNDLLAKQNARNSLKKSIDLLEEKIGRLSSAAQFIRVLRTRKQEVKGLGLETDDFTRSIGNEISLLQIHINAAREALGTSLSAENFTSGTVTGEENKIVFSNVRQHLKQIIKNYRLSNKVVIKPSTKQSDEEAIYYNDELIELPPMSRAGRKEVLNLIKSSTKTDLTRRENITPKLFEKLFITQSEFLEGLANNYSKQHLFSLHPDRAILTKGKWDGGPLADLSEELTQKIKKLILEIEFPLTKAELIISFKTINITEEKAQQVLNYLCDEKHILQSKEVYLLSDDLRTAIKDYLEKIYLHEQTLPAISVLNLQKFPELRDHEATITKALQPGAILTRENLKLNDRCFQLMFQLLKQNNYFKASFLERLGLSNKFTNPIHYQEIETEILRLYESNVTGNSCDLLLCKELSERYTPLWSYLKSMKVVKDPSVKFNLSNHPDKCLDSIKDIVKDNISLLIQNKSEDEQKKYIDSIYTALEKSIGKIKQFENLKIDQKTLQDFLQNGKLPPEALDLAYQCADIVLSLAEDRGWDWGAFAVALIGIIQIAAGVLIGALSFGSAAFISAVLINEGIGDLVFAVQSGLSGNFSWSAYGDRKWQSLLISVATAGVGVGLGAVAAGASLTSTSVSALAQKFIVQLAEVGLNCALTLATDQLIKQVMALILDELDKEFEKWVRSTAVFQLVENNLKTLIGNLYDRFGVDQASKITDELMRDNVQERHASFINIFSAKLNETMKKLSSQLSIAANQLENAGNTTAAIIAKIAKIATQVATATDILNKFRDIASLT
ncbi:MAG: hypothetical protein ACK4PR_04825, partial [Gammaproteobacteria bacterium]